MENVSENQFSGKTYFCTIASRATKAAAAKRKQEQLEAAKSIRYRDHKFVSFYYTRHV